MHWAYRNQLDLEVFECFDFDEFSAKCFDCFCTFFELLTKCFLIAFSSVYLSKFATKMS